MNFDESALQKARDAGYSDDEIKAHLVKSDPKYQKAFDSGYKIDEVAAYNRPAPQAQAALEEAKMWGPGQGEQMRRDSQGNEPPRENAPLLDQITGAVKSAYEESQLPGIFGPTENQKFRNATITTDSDGKGYESYKPGSSRVDQIGLLPALKETFDGYTKDVVNKVLPPDYKFAGIPDIPKIGPQANPVAQAGASIVNQLSGLVQYATSPQGIAGMFAGTTEEMALNKIVGGLFFGQMAPEIPKLKKQYDDAKTPSEAVDAATQLVGTTILASAIGTHTLGYEAPSLPKAGVIEAIKDIPTEKLQKLSTDPDWRAKWKYDPAIVDEVVADRTSAQANAVGATNTAEAVKEKAAPLTMNFEQLNPARNAKPNEQPTEPQQKPPVEPTAPPAPQPDGKKPDQEGTPTGESPKPGAKPGGEVPAVKETITAAQFTKDGVTTEGANHTEAAQKQGVTAPESPGDRETPDYTFKTSTGRTVTREEAAQIAKDSGQLTKEPVNGKLHSGDIEVQSPEPVHVTGEEFGKGLSFPKLRRAAREFMKKMRGQTLETANGDRLLVDREGSKHPASGSRADEELKVLAKLPEVVRASEHADTKPDDGTHPGVSSWHYYKSSVRVGENPRTVTIVAREMKNGKLFYDSYILEQESLNPTPGISPEGKRSGFSGNSGHVESVASSEKGVKGESGIADKPVVDLPDARNTEPQKPGESGAPGAAGIKDPAFTNNRIANYNADVDAKRVARGEEPLMKKAAQTLGEWWDKAMGRMEKNPNAGYELVDEIYKSDKPVSNRDDEALLLHHRIDITNKMTEAADRINDPNTPPEEVAESRLEFARHADDLNRLDDVTRKIGTAWGEAGRMRQQAIKDDYTIPSMIRKKQAAIGGKPLTPDQVKEIQKLHDKISDLQKKLDERDKSKGDEQDKTRDKEADANIDKMKSKTGKQKGKYDPEAEEAKLKASLENNKDNPEYIGGLIQKLAEHFVRQGVSERDALVTAVHDAVKDILPDSTPRDIRDAISGYGKFKELNKDEVKVKLRDLKGQMQQVSKLDDMIQKKQLPKKTGMERRVPTAEERELIKEVNKVKKELGLQATDPATQLKSALDGIKTRLKNAIVDLGREFETGERKSKGPGIPLDAEAERFKALRDQIRGTLDSIEKPEGLTDQQRIERSKDALTKAISEYERRIKEGDFSSRGSKPVTTQEIENLKAKRDSLRDTYKQLEEADSQMSEYKQAAGIEKRIAEIDRKIQQGDLSTRQAPNRQVSNEIEALRAERDAMSRFLNELRNEAKPKLSPDEIALKTYKTRTENRINELNDRIARGDYSKTQRKQITLDAEALKLKAEAERARDKFQDGLERDRLANRNWWQKTGDAFVKWERAIKLSSPITLGKLVAAAATRLGTTPIEEAIGGAYSKIIPQVAAKAPRGGGFSIKAEAKSLTGAITKGMADAASILKSGKSDLETLNQKKHYGDRSWMDFFGETHQMLKSPVKRAEFERSLQKRIEHAIRNGVDVTDPLVQVDLMKEAYIDGNRSIFMQDNFVSTSFNNFVTMLSKNKNNPVAGQISANILRFMLPIVKVPTNLVGESFTHATGLATGSARLGYAFMKGIDNLKPEEAEIIMRNLKKGTVGGALLAYGYFNSENIGGYYQPGEKRKADDVKVGHIRVFDVDVPSWLLHAPQFEVIQFGATVRRVQDAIVKKTGESKGFGEGVFRATAGLLERTPFVGQMLRVDKLFKTKPERDQFLGQLANSTISPLGLQAVAKWIDGNTERKPETIWENIEMGIPFMRQNVPEKAPKSSGTKSMRGRYSIRRRSTKRTR